MSERQVDITLANTLSLKLIISEHLSISINFQRAAASRLHITNRFSIHIFILEHFYSDPISYHAK